MPGFDGAGAIGTGELLLAVAEQLKVPLTTIARQAELGQLTGEAILPGAGAGIRVQADAALQLVDSYLLGLELMQGQAELALEPVSVAGTLADTAHDLYRFAQAYGVELELAVGGKFGPVMGHQRGLKAALLSLGFALVEAEGASEPARPHRLTLAVHRTPHGIVAGMYGDHQAVSASAWRRALELAGRARQPLAALSAGSGAGLFVADTILRSMETRLRTSRHGHRSGLAATLQPSRQLTLV